VGDNPFTPSKPDDPSSGIGTWVIVGICVGGVAVILMIIIVVCFCCKKNNDEQAHAVVYDAVGTEPLVVEKPATQQA